MPFNGAGSFVPLAAPIFPAVPATTIASSYYNANTEDIFDGLTNCVTRDGQSPALANIPMANFQLTGLGPPTLAGMALVHSEVAPVANGTVLLPSLTFASELSTGFFRKSAGVLGVSILGVEVMNYSASGLSLASLTVTGNTVLGDAVGDLLNVAGNSINVIASGNVLIGGTAAVFPSANRKTLEINGTNEALLGFQIAGASAGYLYHNGTNLSLTNTKNGSLNFGTNSQAVVTLTPTFQTLIGPAGPSSGSASGLEVVAAGNSVIVRQTTAASYSGVRWYNDQNSASRALEVDYTGSAYPSATLSGSAAPVGEQASIATTGAYPLTFGTNNTARLIIAAAGTLTDGSGNQIGYANIPLSGSGSIEQGQVLSTTAGFSVGTGFPAGWAASAYNNSAASITITQGGGLTMRLGGTTTTGNRTLAPRGWATIWFLNTGECVVTGPGVA